MAGGGEENVTEIVINDEAHDFRLLLSSSKRDFLVRNNSDQVKIESLKGKKLALYFSASWSIPYHKFAPTLIKVYNELYSKGDFEVIYVSRDQDEESFKVSFSEMPWLAIPFSDSQTRNRLVLLFEVRMKTHCVILDEDGKVVSDNGVKIIRDYGIEAYPFTKQKIKDLKDQEKAAGKNQSLRSIMVSHSHDSVISSDGKKIPVTDLGGKNILLYFSARWCPLCGDFLQTLIDAYHKIKAKDDAFEVIFISSDRDQASFDEFFSGMPWLALPFGDPRKAPLSRTLEVHDIPRLVAIGPSGKTVRKEARDIIMIHGADAYPFTDERLKEIEEQIVLAKGWPEKLILETP